MRRNAAGPDSSCRPPTGSGTTAASPAGSTRPPPTRTGRLLSLAYGDSATVRVTNIGRRRRQNPDIHGYMIDVTTGRWLKENEREDQAAPEEEGLEAPGGVKRKQRVIPYVEDRRNILVTRLSAAVSPETAVTAAIALERGIEAAFQLEDSELSSEGLPDPERRGRALFIESAEGGAGALRRLVDDPGALPKAARTALQIMHFDPDSGADISTDEPGAGRERCVRACYDCLLSYGNQRMHEMINRHLVRDLMLRLATAAVDKPAASGESRPQSRRTRGRQSSLPGSAHTICDSPTTWIATPKAPGRTSSTTCRMGTPRSSSRGASGDDNEQAGRDEQAHEDLRDLGWSVIIIGTQRRLGSGDGPLPEVSSAPVTKVTPMTTTELPAFEVGTLVRARGREWVVLPQSAPPGFLVLRPLGESDDEVAGVFPALEQVSSATFEAPDPGDVGTAVSAGLLRTALRIGFRASAGPFRSLARLAVEPRAYQLVPLLMALRPGTGPAADLQRRRHRQDHQGRPDRRRAAGARRRDRPGGAVRTGARRAVAAGAGHEVRHPRRAGAARHDPQAGRGAAAGRGALLFDRFRHIVVSTDFVEQARAAGTVLAWLPRTC